MSIFKKDINIDESRLNSASQQKVASMVRSLPDDDLSMSWRSDLNVKLMAAQDAKRKKKVTRRIFTWGTSLSCGLAATVMGVVMFNSTPIVHQGPKVDSSAFASELVNAHQESLVLASVSGISSSNHETSITEDSYSTQDDLL